MLTRFGIADHEIGRLSQRQPTGYRQSSAQIQAYLDWMTLLVVLAQTLLSWSAIYRKTQVQCGADLTVYIRTISGWVDLTCILYIFYIFFTIFAQISLTFCQDYPPAHCGSAIPPNIGVYSIHISQSISILACIKKLTDI